MESMFMKVRNDFIFKKIFGEPGNESILKSLLEPILQLDIKEVSISLDRELKKENISLKTGFLDVKASLYDGTKVNVEIQVGREYNLAKWTFFYLARLYSNDFLSGQKYDSLSKAVTVNILDYVQFEKDESFHKTFKIVDENGDNSFFSDVAEIHVLELEKVRRLKDYGDNKLRDWLLFIGANSKEEIQMLAEKNVDIKKAADVLEKLSQNDEARLMYESREKYLHDYNSNLYAAKEEGKEEGIRLGHINTIYALFGVKHNLSKIAISERVYAFSNEEDEEFSKLMNDDLYEEAFKILGFV